MFHFKLAGFGGNSKELSPLVSSPAQSGSKPIHYTAVSPARSSQRWNIKTAGLNGEVTVHRSMSTPHVHEDGIVHRTLSGGLLFKRGCVSEEQEKRSQARSDELSVLYELCEEKNTELNKNVKFKVDVAKYRGSPSLQTISPKEAVKVFEERKREYNATKVNIDPLLTLRERRERMNRNSVTHQQGTLRPEASKAHFNKVALMCENKRMDVPSFTMDLSLSDQENQMGNSNTRNVAFVDILWEEGHGVEVLRNDEATSPFNKPLLVRPEKSKSYRQHQESCTSQGRMLPTLC